MLTNCFIGNRAKDLLLGCLCVYNNILIIFRLCVIAALLNSNLLPVLLFQKYQYLGTITIVSEVLPLKFEDKSNIFWKTARINLVNLFKTNSITDRQKMANLFRTEILFTFIIRNSVENHRLHHLKCWLWKKYYNLY